MTTDVTQVPKGRGRMAGKVVLVIGGGSVLPGWGNGKAAAVLYAVEGAKVLVADQKSEAAVETAAIIAEGWRRGIGDGLRRDLESRRRRGREALRWRLRPARCPAQ